MSAEQIPDNVIAASSSSGSESKQIHLTTDNMDDPELQDTFQMVKELKRVEWFKKMGDLAKEPGTESLPELLERLNRLLNEPRDPEPEVDNLLDIGELDTLIDYLSKQSEYLYQTIYAYKQLRSMLDDIYKHNKREDISEDQKLNITE